ncbi:MAG: calcium-binding protein [Pseudomonadota bacterium]
MYDDYPNDSTTTGVLTLEQDAFGRMDRPDPYDEYFYDADWFRIDLEAGQLYQITAQTTDPIYLRLRMFGVRTSIEHFQDGLSGVARIVFTAHVTNTNFVQVDNLIGESEGSYQLTAEIYEIPESVDTRISLRELERKDSEVGTSFDRDFFSVQLQQGWTYGVHLLGAGYQELTLADPNVRVYDGDSSLIGSNNNGGTGRDSYLEFVAPQTGTHYLSASGVGAGTGTYQIYYQLIDYVDDAGSNRNTEARVPVRANQTTFVDGSLEIGSDVDWYKVDLVAGQWYRLSGGTLLRDPDNNVAQYINGQTYYKARTSGTHHWVVRNPAGQPRNYRLIITDNMPAVISAAPGLTDLTGHESVDFSRIFTLNNFPADHVQVFSEADFTTDNRLYRGQQLHTLTTDQFAEAKLSAILRRGEYRVSVRGLEGSTVSGWAHANIRSDQSPSVLVGQGNIWNSSNTQRGSDNVITYRFADAVPSYFAPGRFTGFEMVSEGVQNLFNFIFGYASYPESLTSWMPQISNYANLKFEYDDSENADIQIFTADATRPATGYRPGMYGFGDIVLSNSEFGGSTVEPMAGDGRYLQILRAVGSALGIKHWAPQFTRDETVQGRYSSNPFPHSFGYLDVAFLREAYGESQLGDPTHHGREDRLGYWPERFTRTINRQSDGNKVTGEYADQPVVIDLREGAISYVEDRWQNFIIGDGQVVERAVGGDFADTLTGNSVDNWIQGNDGDDLIAGMAGHDRLEGGRGSDTYVYELDGGHDTIIETGASREDGGFDTLQIKANLGFDSIENDLTFRRAGNDLLIDLDLNGQYNRYNGTIRIKHMNYAPWQVETLDLRNLSSDLGTYSLVSIWNAATNQKQRFAGTGQSDAFGQIAAPLG